MTLIIHVLAGLMYAVLLAPLWLFLGVKLAIRIAHWRGGPHGWLARAERILEDDGGAPRKARGEADRPRAARATL